MKSWWFCTWAVALLLSTSLVVFAPAHPWGDIGVVAQITLFIYGVMILLVNAYRHLTSR